VTSAPSLPSGVGRLIAALAAAVFCFLAVVLSTGHLTNHPFGAADNGDGVRLYCGDGLLPATADGHANWKGGVVLAFDKASSCADPIPSSSLPILKVASAGSDAAWSLTRLGWLYASLAAGIAAVGAWAATARGLNRALILVPPLAPLANANFSRFFLSTYSEPAGLLGAVGMMCGLGVVVVTKKSDRLERGFAFGLVATGALLAATAKIGYAPVLVVGLLACSVTSVELRRTATRWEGWLVGPAVALLTLLVALVPLHAALDWQNRYGEVNAHNLIYTLVLTEVPGSARALGLPMAAESAAGDAYYPNGPAGVAGSDIVAADPAKARRNAFLLLAHHPGAVLRSIGIGMQATQDTSLSYLKRSAWTPETTPGVIGTFVGDQGASGPTLRSWLNEMAAPWWPSVAIAAGIFVGIVGLVKRRRPWSTFARLGGVSSFTAVGLVIAAVFGDGYFEIAKHAWLAAYMVEVTGVALLGAAALAAAEAVEHNRTTRRSSLSISSLGRQVGLGHQETDADRQNPGTRSGSGRRRTAPTLGETSCGASAQAIVMSQRA
jgi:hypothetical protein